MMDCRGDSLHSRIGGCVATCWPGAINGKRRRARQISPWQASARWSRDRRMASSALALRSQLCRPRQRQRLHLGTGTRRTLWEKNAGQALWNSATISVAQTIVAEGRSWRISQAFPGHVPRKERRDNLLETGRSSVEMRIGSHPDVRSPFSQR